MSLLMVLWGWRVESKHGQESPPTRPESPVHFLGATQSHRRSSHWVRTRPDFHFYINRIGLTAVRRTEWGEQEGVEHPTCLLRGSLCLHMTSLRHPGLHLLLLPSFSSIIPSRKQASESHCLPSRGSFILCL